MGKQQQKGPFSYEGLLISQNNNEEKALKKEERKSNFFKFWNWKIFKKTPKTDTSKPASEPIQDYGIEIGI